MKAFIKAQERPSEEIRIKNMLIGKNAFYDINYEKFSDLQLEYGKSEFGESFPALSGSVTSPEFLIGEVNKLKVHQVLKKFNIDVDKHLYNDLANNIRIDLIPGGPEPLATTMLINSEHCGMYRREEFAPIQSMQRSSQGCSLQ
ncbi:MAG: hypothetical protein IPP74_01655 [Alphaproteobacteria bacterium]|nr:hypothetical protein [Alphaproteobacteria bacterium]